MTDYQQAYENLSAKVKEMIKSQDQYLTSKDPGKIIHIRNQAKEIKEMINPKPPKQSQMEWLAQ